MIAYLIFKFVIWLYGIDVKDKEPPPIAALTGIELFAEAVLFAIFVFVFVIPLTRDLIVMRINRRKSE